MTQPLSPSEIPAPTFARFMAYWADRGNWGGTPLVGGNVGENDPQDKGFIVTMKKLGLVRTSQDSDRTVWISFTALGEATAGAAEAAKKEPEAGPWADGSVAAFEPYIDEKTGTVGFRCEVNGKTSYIFLNPSTGGDSPDVFLYQNETGDPADDGSVVFVGFAPPASK